MHTRLTNKFLTVSAAMALFWIAAPFSRAESESIQDECEVAVAEPVAPAPALAQAEECDPTPAPIVAQATTESVAAVRKGPRELNDNELDDVSGGITGSFDMTQSGNMTLTDNSVQSISLSDQAQQNLSSLVNILSINSTISVMMNLNVNINSTVGTVNQGNSGTQSGTP